MRFPVKNCSSKVIVSESLEIFESTQYYYYYYYHICKYTYLNIDSKLPNLVNLTRADVF